MNRAIKFKLKNGRTVTIRRIRANDYDACMKYLSKFSRDPGALQTNQYPGQPKKDKEMSIKMYESDTRLFIGIFDGKDIVGMANIGKQNPEHPYQMGIRAGIGFGMLKNYTHNGLGTKMLGIMENWARKNGVKMLYADIRHLNIPSIATFIKSGFLITGLQRNVDKVNGNFIHRYMVEKDLLN